jgi:RNA polymerase sigma-70 factor (ECF subfamily)
VNQPRSAGFSVVASDEELVRRLVEGDAVAKEALYRKHFPMVWRTALRLLDRRADVEDVTQDAFLTAFDDIGDLRETSAFAAWLLRVTVHQAHRHIRRRKLMRVLGLDRGFDDVALDQLAHDGVDPVARQTLRRIDRQLHELPTQHRIAWTLRRVEGYSVEEVADACECSLATAKRWIRAADAEVMPQIDPESDDEA